MAITQDDLNDFQVFAAARLAKREADSMAELVSAWEDQRRLRQSVEALQESHADAEAGRVVPAEEAFANTRRTLDLSE